LRVSIRRDKKTGCGNRVEFMRMREYKAGAAGKSRVSDIDGP